jgi:hypothetical protein
MEQVSLFSKVNSDKANAIDTVTNQQEDMFVKFDVENQNVVYPAQCDGDFMQQILSEETINIFQEQIGSSGFYVCSNNYNQIDWLKFDAIKGLCDGDYNGPSVIAEYKDAESYDLDESFATKSGINNSSSAALILKVYMYLCYALDLLPKQFKNIIDLSEYWWNLLQKYHYYEGFFMDKIINMIAFEKEFTKDEKYLINKELKLHANGSHISKKTKKVEGIIFCQSSQLRTLLVKQTILSSEKLHKKTSIGYKIEKDIKFLFQKKQIDRFSCMLDSNSFAFSSFTQSYNNNLTKYEFKSLKEIAKTSKGIHTKLFKDTLSESEIKIVYIYLYFIIMLNLFDGEIDMRCDRKRAELLLQDFEIYVIREGHIPEAIYLEDTGVYTKNHDFDIKFKKMDDEMMAEAYKTSQDAHIESIYDRLKEICYTDTIPLF